jgi:hypothetical protein
MAIDPGCVLCTEAEGGEIGAPTPGAALSFRRGFTSISGFSLSITIDLSL